MARKILESFSIEEAFKALNRKSIKEAAVGNTSKIRESTASKNDFESIKKLVANEDVMGLISYIKSHTSCADSDDVLRIYFENSIDVDYPEEGFQAVADILAMDDVLKASIPNLEKWWTITDRDNFDAAWNIFVTTTNNEVLGVWAETQGDLFINGMDFVDDDQEIEDVANAHGVANTYIPCVPENLEIELSDAAIDQANEKYASLIEEE